MIDLVHIFESTPLQAKSLVLPTGVELPSRQSASFWPKAGYPVILTKEMRPHPVLSRYLRELENLDSKTAWQYSYELRRCGDYLEEIGSSFLTVTSKEINDYRESRMSAEIRPMSEASWTRNESVLRGLFMWMAQEGIRDADWYLRPRRRKRARGRRGMKIRHLTQQQWSVFMQLGVRGQTPTGGTHAGFKGTATRRMRTGCEVALGTGMRLEEFSTILVAELGAHADGQKNTFWIEACAKFERPRRILLGNLARKSIDAYIRGERRTLVEKAARGLEKRATDLYVVEKLDFESQTTVGRIDGVRRTEKISLLTPEKRDLMVMEGDFGLEPLALFVTRNGRMASTSTWQQSFRQASQRYRSWTDSMPDVIMPAKVTAHDLRHTFAVTMLEFLDKFYSEKSGEASANRLSRFKALRKLQEMMGHADAATTLQYLNYVDRLEAPVEDAWDGWDDPTLDFNDYWTYLEEQK